MKEGTFQLDKFTAPVTALMCVINNEKDSSLQMKCYGGSKCFSPLSNT